MTLMTTIPDRLILFEFPGEVEIFLNHCRKTGADPAGFLIVALQPSARVYCKEKNLPCRDTLLFFNNDSHIRAVRESHRLTRLIEDKLEFTGEFPLKNTLMNTFIYYSRFYLNNYIRVLEIMKGIKEKYPDVEIYVVKQNPEPDAGPWTTWGIEPFLSKKDRFTPIMVETYCKQNGMKYNEITGSDVKQRAKPSKVKSLLSALMKHIARFFLVRKLRKLSHSETVLFAAPSYNLDRLRDDIHLRFPRKVCAFITQQTFTAAGYIKLCLKRMKGTSVSIPLDVFTRGPKRKGNELFHRLKESYRLFIEQWGSEFVYENCTLVGELNKKVEADLLTYLYYLSRLARGQNVILENLKPGVALSPVSIGLFQAWGELCKKLSIPAVVIPQKGLLAPANEYAQIEEHYIGRAQVTDDFEYAASQSPLTGKYLEWSGYKGTIMETANLIFSKVDIGTSEEKRQNFCEGIGKDERIIVYAPSMKSRKSCRFYVLETLDELLASVEDIIRAVSEMTGAHLIIRVHPGEPITKKEIETLLTIPGNVSISDKGTFEEVLSIADLVVSFSSTIIQESLLNGVPVVLYDKWKRYDHLDAPRVETEIPKAVSACYYIDEPGFLSTSLQWILDHHVNGNRSFSIFKDYVYPSRYAEPFFDFVNKTHKVS